MMMLKKSEAVNMSQVKTRAFKRYFSIDSVRDIGSFVSEECMRKRMFYLAPWDYSLMVGGEVSGPDEAHKCL